jgi:hypothetical protein
MKDVAAAMKEGKAVEVLLIVSWSPLHQSHSMRETVKEP